jgi:hypothetical protein
MAVQVCVQTMTMEELGGEKLLLEELVGERQFEEGWKEYWMWQWEKRWKLKQQEVAG